MAGWFLRFEPSDPRKARDIGTFQNLEGEKQSTLKYFMIQQAFNFELFFFFLGILEELGS